MVATIKQRVTRSIEFLDKRKPSWCGKLDLEVLDLESAEFCILGQLYGSKKPRDVQDFSPSGYAIGRGKLFTYVKKDYGKNEDKFAVDFGFESDSGSYRRLNEEWRKQIIERQTSGKCK